MPKSNKPIAPAARLAVLASVMASFAAHAAPPVVIGAGTTDTTRRTLAGTDSVTIQGGGTINTSGTSLTMDSSVPAPGITITNAGTLKSGNRGIDTNGSTAGSPFNFTLTNNAGGLITSSDDSVRINSDVAVGRIVIENAGTITSASGQAIDFDKINTSGDPDSDPSNDGVDMQGHAASVHNYAGGLISGARHGITSDVDVDVINEAGGTIIGRNGSGVGSDGDGKVVNYGTITGAIDTTSVNGDGDGVDIDGKADIINYGTIQGVGAKGEKDGSPNNSEGIAAGGGTIRNLTAQSIISGQANGILIDDSAEGPAPHATTLVNEGTIRGVTGFAVRIIGSQPDTVTNAGLIEGGNGLALDLGAGDDTLNLLTGSRIVGLVDGGAGSDTVNLIGSGTFAGAVNVENLTVGGGSWVLTGNQQYANGITIGRGGSLDVQGTLDGTLTLTQGALLNGNGTLGSANVAGTIAPGHSIGRLTFTGSYAQLAGSTYQVDIANGGQSDLIKVAGTASLAGSVTVTPMPGTQIAPGQRYTILSAGQGVSGTYGSVSGAGPLLFLQPTLSYDPNHVYLAFDRNATRYADIAGTANQRAAANGADSQPAGQFVHDAIALMNDPQDARAAFDSLSGEIHASLKTSLLEDTHFARDAINDRLRAAFARGGAQPAGLAGAGGATPLPAAGRPAVWGRAYGAWGDIDGNGNAAKLERSIGGFMFGADFPIASDWRAGVAAAYDRTDLNADGRASSADVDSYTLAAYAGTQLDGLALRVGAAHTWHRIDTRRDVAFAGYAGTTDKASYDGNTAQVFGEAGYALQYGTATFEPFAGIAYANLHTQGFDEGGDIGLSGRGDNTGVTYATLGLRASTRLEAAGTTAILHGMAGWRHAFGDTTPTATQSLPAGSPFTVSGVPVAVDAALLEVGLNVQVARNVRVDLSYQGQFGDGVRQNGVVANVNVRF